MILVVLYEQFVISDHSIVPIILYVFTVHVYMSILLYYPYIHFVHYSHIHFMFYHFFSDIEGLGGVPPIRPLETLHNALSLKQLDAFLEHMALAQFRTPLSSPPKMPSTPKQSRSQPPPLGLQSPSSSKWSRESSLEVL